ncbi:hypothetical protein DIURU_005246 [Diutina rugosa]|uniref:Glycoside hydrolase family 17 protein n=1 Tax=Diutina rugosa TaxID=5481 RepID=A0A642UDU4_DIURU|nr:uncharacterized protein DIURU_005246 [Diutina rugosa]KAA8897269.1 hypothetical protein DIURU_005246 [Diutina rugosa]
MQPKIYLVSVAGLLASVDALPIDRHAGDVDIAKRAFFSNLLSGIEGLFSSSPATNKATTPQAAQAPAAAAPAAAISPTTTIVEYAQPTAAATQPPTTKGFFANLFSPKTTAPAPAPVAAATTNPAIQVFAPASTQPASTQPAVAAVAAAPVAAPTSSSVKFFDHLFDDLSGFFGLDGDSPSSTPSSSPQPQPQSSQPQPSSNLQAAPATSSYQQQSQAPQSSSDPAQGGNQGSSSASNSGASPTNDLGGKQGSGYGGTGGSGKASGSPDDVAAVSAGEVPGWYSVGDSSQSAVPTGATPGGQNAQYAQGSKGMSYSPYRKSGQCKSSQEVASDIKKLQGFDLIRLYSTDCSGIENVLASMGSSQQLFLGVWNLDTASVQGGLNDIANAVKTSNRGWSAVHTIAIGNERVNEGQATVGDISAALSTARDWLKANAPQYNGAVVSVDTLVAVKNNPGLCGLSDYIAVNCHPYWDGGVLPENSGPWLKQQAQELAGICNNNKQIMITETGWPTKGGNYGSAVPSVENQKTALQSIISTMGSDVLAFTMYNDYWKAGGTNGVEQYWGVFGDPDA